MPPVPSVYFWTDVPLETYTCVPSLNASCKSCPLSNWTGVDQDIVLVAPPVTCPWTSEIPDDVSYTTTAYPFADNTLHTLPSLVDVGS